MKCVSDLSSGDVKIIRVPNEEAAKKVKTGEFIYASKQEWKAARRLYK